MFVQQVQIITCHQVNYYLVDFHSFQMHQLKQVSKMKKGIRVCVYSFAVLDVLILPFRLEFFSVLGIFVVLLFKDISYYINIISVLFNLCISFCDRATIKLKLLITYKAAQYL